VIAGVSVQVLPSGWLGLSLAKDPADLAALAQRDPAARNDYDDAVQRVRAACQALMGDRPERAPKEEKNAL
jgi:hypothetical protein